VQFSPFDSILVAFNVDDYSPIYFIKTDDYSIIAKWEKEKYLTKTKFSQNGTFWAVISPIT